MKAMILKEFRQMRRDRRMMVLLLFVPIVMLTVFGYAARFDVGEIRTAVVGPVPAETVQQLDPAFDVTKVDPDGDPSSARRRLRDSEVEMAIVATPTGPEVLLDGTDLFSAQSALRRLGPLAGGRVEVLFNPKLNTAVVMVPSIIGFILLFVGLFVTSLGVVREREQGTLEQFAVTPLRPVDVIVGKIVPYFVITFLNLVVAAVAGVLIFDVPFRGSIPLFVAFGVAFLVVVLGLGVLVSTASKSQGEAIQLTILVLLPQVMLSGMIWPLRGMPPGVRWLSSVFPLTYFITGMRAILLKAAPLDVLWLPLAVLVGMATVIFALSVLRFRRDLAPHRSAAGGTETGTPAVAI